MKILVSNDDGIDAPGIRVLADVLRAAGHFVAVVAPDRDRSGASNSLTLEAPVRVSRCGDFAWRVSGTPTDCVHIAITGLLDFEPDIVVSGINSSENLSDDVIYSGTVAAAMEGRSLGLPAIAVSLVPQSGGGHYQTAAAAVVEILSRLSDEPVPADTILNVNVPDRALSEITGFEVTRLGHRHRGRPSTSYVDARGREWWCIGVAGLEADSGPGTDFDAVRSGRISITPIHVDLTRYRSLGPVKVWAERLALMAPCEPATLAVA